MPRRNFYEVPSDAYLFRSKIKPRTKKEEAVRQWCVQELIRAYGACITDIEFERPVQRGSVNNWIDILILRLGKPWVVIECKNLQDRNPAKGLVQARSYATAPDVRAEFVVYTNGRDWRVERLVGSSWVPVLDLPHLQTAPVGRDLTSHLNALNDLQPMLRILDAEVKGIDASRFLTSMQTFFNSAGSWLTANDALLLSVGDNLLRVIAEPKNALSYRLGKLAQAVTDLGEFGASRGIGIATFQFGGISINEELRFLHANLLNCLPSINAVGGMDSLLLNLLLNLLDYSMGLTGKVAKYPPFPPSLHASLRAYLGAVLLIHFGLKLPE